MTKPAPKSPPAPTPAAPSPLPPVAEVKAKTKKRERPTVSFRSDTAIVAVLDSLRPFAPRADGSPAKQSDVSRAILDAVLGDPAVVGRVMAAPGRTIFDKIRGLLVNKPVG